MKLEYLDVIFATYKDGQTVEFNYPASDVTPKKYFELQADKSVRLVELYRNVAHMGGQTYAA